MPVRVTFRPERNIRARMPAAPLCSPETEMSGPKSPKSPAPASLKPAPRRRAGVKPLGLSDYLQKILTARVYDVAVETSLELARNLSLRMGNRVFLKREDTQPVFSFKLRGAYNKMARLSALYLELERLNHKSKRRRSPSPVLQMKSETSPTQTSGR